MSVNAAELTAALPSDAAPVVDTGTPECEWPSSTDTTS